MIGVNFQPGSGSGGGGSRPTGNPNGVQEAIKVLSLRLPKVVGAQGIAPAPLLQSGGSNGMGSRVDSVVNSILGRMFPTGQQPPSNMPSFGTAPPMSSAPNMPNFGGMSQPQGGADYTVNPWSQIPRIIAGGPGTTPPGDFSLGPDGRPLPGSNTGLPPGIYEPAPFVPPQAPSTPEPPMPSFDAPWAPQEQNYI
jgi:hypothetical protein